MEKNEVKQKYFLKWTQDDIVNLKKDTGIATIFVEVNSKGEVIREVGLDETGMIVHKCPSENYKYGTYGIFDLVKLKKTQLRNDLAEAQFEELWKR